ncbi:hypothetical protein ACQZV8_13565 [Magnetococcales bacterium HHB-1]
MEAKIFMTTALDEQKSVVKAFFEGGCTDYIVKPISRDLIFDKLKEYHLIP